MTRPLTTRPSPESRSAYRTLRVIPTRWMDNDVYGHINNVTYYSYFDTVVNGYLIDRGALDIATSPVIGLVVETHCNYFSPIAFPDAITAGLRVAHRGTSTAMEPRELGGPERDAAWQVLLGVWPNFAVYEQRTDRLIPVFRLVGTD